MRAFDSYPWRPLPESTQAAAWARLLDFAVHLLGSPNAPGNTLAQAAAATALLRWLQMLKLTADDAIAWLLNPAAAADPMLEQLANAAVADAATQLDVSMMQRHYQLQPAAERAAWVERLRAVCPVVDSSLDGLPSWAFVNELPTLHGLFLEEARRGVVQPDPDGTR